MKLKATLMLAFLVIASLDALSGQFMDEHQRDKINNGEKRSPDPRWGNNNGRSLWPWNKKAAFDGGEYTDEHQRDKINNGEKRSPDPRWGNNNGRSLWPLKLKVNLKPILKGLRSLRV
ncbi:uncharacterized protein LOC141878910 isoform X2 [Acropora palmata]|uniref:uncharacterized protein LOC141878910 isoform X2 n=1 Tax=Acropora palmata TaxID=6131 RepID=UPI003DA17E07